MNLIINGDCLEVLPGLEENSIDSVICDPPYGLEFMGKDWDHGIPGVIFWKEIMRVAKPGAYLLAFGGTRTFHRLTVAIEDAGWEIRDCMMWLYGCLSEDTEILTEDGFKLYDRTTKYDKIAVYDLKNDIYKWETPKCWQKYRIHEDTAYHIKSNCTDQIVSRNHNCLVERNGRLVFVKAEKLSPMENMPVLQNDFCEIQEGFSNPLLKTMQRPSPWGRMETTCPQRSQKLVRIFQNSFKKAHDWLNESILERGYHLQEKKRQLLESIYKICSLPDRIFKHGTERRLCYGTPSFSSSGNRQTVNETGKCSPYQSQCRGQQDSKLNAVQKQHRSQKIRTRPTYNTTLATVTPIKYSGLIFCPTVSTGAFVARRNGKLFITGNSGFPKSLDISKAIDKMYGAEREVIGKKMMHTPTKNGNYDDDNYDWGEKYQDVTIPSTDNAKKWSGFGTALKPAWEPIIVARKPISGKTVAANVLKYGTGGLNIDGCRIGVETRTYKGSGAQPNKLTNHEKGDTGIGYADGNGKDLEFTVTGRWPANLILDEEAGAVLDEQSGEHKTTYVAKHHKNNRNGEFLGELKHPGEQGFNDSGGASRFFYCAKVSRKERDLGCEELEEKLRPMSNGAQIHAEEGYDKAQSIGLNRVVKLKNNHPTVKPIKLMTYLCKLVTPPNGTILDPFMGSGSTGIAAIQEKFNFIGIEKEKDYLKIAENRIKTVDPNLEIFE